MKTKTIVSIIVAAVLVLICTVSYISAYNYGNSTENQLSGILENNENIYAQGTQKVLEIAQVPAMYADDYKALIKADIEGRYGPGGSKASVLFLKEHDLKLDGKMYVKIQQTVEAFRNDFAVNQTLMIDVKRGYKNELGSFWSGMWLRIAGYPKLDLEAFKPVITQKTEEVFKAGKEAAPLKLR